MNARKMAGARNAPSWLGSTGAAGLLVLLPLLLGCRTPALEEHGRAISPADAAPAGTTATIDASVSASALVPEEPAAESVEVGIWAKTDLYDLRLEAVSLCISTTTADQPRPGARFLGLKIRVRAKTRSLFVSARHATLRDGGYLFQAMPPGRTLRGCRPALNPTHVRNTTETTGFVVFELPAKTGKLVLEFMPTRWGGASRARIALPEPTVAARTKTKRSSGASRRDL